MKEKCPGYESVEEWAFDLQLIWKNCARFNLPDSDVVHQGYELRSFLKNYLHEKLQNQFDYCFAPDWSGPQVVEKETISIPAPLSSSSVTEQLQQPVNTISGGNQDDMEIDALNSAEKETTNAHEAVPSKKVQVDTEEDVEQLAETDSSKLRIFGTTARERQNLPPEVFCMSFSITIIIIM